MRLRDGSRIGDDQRAPAGAIPDLTDFATAGAILGLLDEMGALTDVVRTDEWIVAVRAGVAVQGYIAETLGEAAAWAMLACWGHVEMAQPTAIIGEA